MDCAQDVSDCCDVSGSRSKRNRDQGLRRIPMTDGILLDVGRIGKAELKYGRRLK